MISAGRKNRFIYLIISPTYFVYRVIKNKKYNNVIDKGRFTDFFNKVCLGISVGINILLYKTVLPWWIVTLFLIYCFSRVNNILITYWIDAKCKLESKPGNKINKLRCIKLSISSYINAVLDFASIYYICNNSLNYNFFDSKFGSILDSIYFSFSNIFTAGYNGPSPINLIVKYLTIYEVILGMIIIIFNITIYMNDN